jgi:phosphoribosylaminoimidazole-succinocarboxamide synthase
MECKGIEFKLAAYFLNPIFLSYLIMTPSQAALHTSNITSLPLLARGKVRDNYAVGDDRILMVASDRISAFDVIMGQPIPGKGVLLTQMALYWFDKLGPNGLNICPIHLTGDAPESVVTPAEVPQVAGRSMLVKRLKPILVEAVVRGYLAGSGWKEYQDNGAVCGVKLPAGLKNASKLPEPIYTPAAKAEMGDHDENITFEKTVEMIGLDLATRIRDISIAIYKAASEIAATKGIIIADTKFEFGLDTDGTLVLMDEVLTPDSSRYWPAESYAEGVNPPSFDKQFLRDWLETAQVAGKPWSKTPPAPHLPHDVIEKTAAKYQEALTRLTA